VIERCRTKRQHLNLAATKLYLIRTGLHYWLRPDLVQMSLSVSDARHKRAVMFSHVDMLERLIAAAFSLYFRSSSSEKQPKGRDYNSSAAVVDFVRKCEHLTE
jgi:hypothetical protein